MAANGSPKHGERNQTAIRVLHYIENRTSSKYPAWRDTTIHFLHELLLTTARNPAISVHFYATDGARIFSKEQQVAYIHFYQRHFLIMAESDYLIWDVGQKLFRTRHKGSYPRMWKATTRQEVSAFLAYLARLARAKHPHPPGAAA